ncbi:exonuclease subunit SbcC [Coleofasciculus sp. FACHB-T130]|uniref:exonuclease subunit SbcC n=1 Tax=Cyanophyceae TaxID=3028117 RepID=UPI001686B570|nr:exonuclease subunit SbcC [Coleofasciculus sp. FACHB-T130]MBD1879103.1 exonuclease subunit SbcC [Coleofasciculus sp. FACHB-T130]
MIPQQLVLKNFLSYREATLEFSGLHTACICGSNGAGKSSLLEAITWTIWGESRAATEDDVIHAGAKEVRVDFTFQCDRQTYRIIRTRIRGQGGSLEFQVQSSGDFRSLTGRGIRATQEAIVHHLKLDYDTFVNSAYLRQGRADEFMLKRPSERKEILADLLKLSQYEELAEQAKDLSRQLKGQAEQLDQNLQTIKQQLQQKDAIAQQQPILETQLAELQQTQAVDNEKVQSLLAIQHQRQTWEQQLSFVRQQYQNLTKDCDRYRQEIATTQLQQQQLEALLNQKDQITAGYAHYQDLQTQEETLTAQSQAYQDAQQQRQQLQRRLEQQINELNLQLRQAQGQLEAVRQSRADIQQILSRTEEVEAGLKQLQEARGYVSYLDRLQLQVAPLVQRRGQVQMELDRSQARLSARLEELRKSAAQLQDRQKRLPQLQQQLQQVQSQIQQLDKKRVYQERVQEKELQQRSSRDRLQAAQKECETKLAEIDQKLQLIQTPNASCPLCDRPLDEHHWQLVVQKTHDQQQGIQDQFWDVEGLLAVCEYQLQGLRKEITEIAQALANYDSLREQRGQLAAESSAMAEIQTRLQQIEVEKQQIERSLSSGNYAPDRQEELRHLEQQLQQLNYNEQDHALARGEVERWRWAEIKQAEVKQAQRRQAQIDAQMPELVAKIANLQSQMQQLQVNSELSRQIEALDREMAEIGYERSQHDALRTALRKSQSWQVRYQELASAQQQYPSLLKRSQDLEQSLQMRSQDLQQMTTQIDTIVRQLQQTPDTKAEITTIEQQIQRRRLQLDEKQRQLGSLQQQQHYLETLQTQHDALTAQHAKVRQQYRVYQELGQAFGKNGIQTLMIENILPQLEAETNTLLSRLSGNQLHVQFVTQKAGRSGRSAKKASKMIDTLDILIADARGTRPYETYSGGEAFRINFAIRLALAKLLAQRAGTALQMLIIDEGFGTQDAEGCDRLIAAINAIAPDFACILTVTHMPQFKEAFQTRIEVYKTPSGSHLSLVL